VQSLQQMDAARLIEALQSNLDVTEYVCLQELQLCSHTLLVICCYRML
jgi:uncharacterized protein YuzB (UPF0349 family)